MTRSSRPAPCSSPYLKMDLVRHPSFSRCIALLRECGVRVLHEPDATHRRLWFPSHHQHAGIDTRPLATKLCNQRN
jgi:hypothetical protein